MTNMKWQNRYQSASSDAPECPPHVLARLSSISPGALLDIASGDGAVALAAARLGWKVTAVDFSAAALQRLNQFAKDDGLEIHRIEADLETDLLPSVANKHYDLITVCRYKPIRALYAWSADRLVPNGHLLVSTFNLKHHYQTGFNRRFVLEEGELLSIDSRLACEFYGAEGESQAFDSYLMKRGG